MRAKWKNSGDLPASPCVCVTCGNSPLSHTCCSLTCRPPSPSTANSPGGCDCFFRAQWMLHSIQPHDSITCEEVRVSCVRVCQVHTQRWFFCSPSWVADCLAQWHRTNHRRHFCFLFCSFRTSCTPAKLIRTYDDECKTCLLRSNLVSRLKIIIYLDLLRNK